MIKTIKHWKIGSITVCLLFLLFSAPVFALQFSDIHMHFAEDAIRTWSDREVVQGYEGQFRPNAEITRGELAVILNRILSYAPAQQGINQFEDLDQNYYTQSMLSINEQGILKGNNGYLRPLDHVTREEAAVMLARAFKLVGEQTSTGFLDNAEISAWAKKDVATMANYGFMNGYQGKVNPKKPLTRGELVQLLDNMVVYYIRQSGEYSEPKNKGNRNGFVIIKAPQTLLTNWNTQYQLLITAGEEISGLHIRNSQFGQMNVLHRQKPMMILLEKANLTGITGNNKDMEFYADGESKVAVGTIQAEALAAGQKKWKEAQNRLGRLPEPGITDEYKPQLPAPKSENKPQPDSQPTPSPAPAPSPNPQPQPEPLSQFLPVFTGITSGGEIHLTAGNEVELPEALPIMLRKNGENTGEALPITWQGEKLEQLKKGLQGKYQVQITTTTDVIINGENYGVVEMNITFIID